MSQWNSYCITKAFNINHILYDVACVTQITYISTNDTLNNS